ncbi:MAG: tetratricopeptide repeat protein, partial [Planctomycetales bacterium]
MSLMPACTDCDTSRPYLLGVRAILLGLVLLFALPASPSHGQVRDNSILKPIYFSTFRELYRGKYDSAYRGFRRALKSGIRTIETRWIDSICYYTMLGEVYYRQGDLEEAEKHYDSALRLYVKYSDWMLRMQFPDTIPEKRSGGPEPPWGKTKRKNFLLSRFPKTFNMSRGGQRIVSANGKAGIANIQQLHALHADELVRCTCLAIRRYNELLGPSAKYDQLARDVLSAVTARKGPPNHWSEAWLDLQAGVAFSMAGKKEEAVEKLQRSLLISGELDHPLTCVGMLELGRLALQEANYDVANNWFNEAALSAFYYNRFEVIQEAFRLMQLGHIVTGKKESPPGLAKAAEWANRKGMKEMYLSMLVMAA